MTYLDALEEENDEELYCEEYKKLVYAVGKTWTDHLVNRAISGGALDISLEDARQGHHRIQSYYDVLIALHEGSS